MSDKTVCVDLDGVLAQYDEWKGVEKFGPVIPGARFFLEALRRVGFKIVIHTTRCSPDVNPQKEEGNFPPEPDWLPGGRMAFWTTYLVDLVRQWLNDNDLPFDEIWSGRGKPLADIYIDDRAVACRPQDDPEAFKNAVLEAQGLTHKAKSEAEK